MAATAALPLQHPPARSVETHQLYLEKLVREHHMDRALEYFNQFRFVPTRITMICSVLHNPMGPLTTALLDEGRELVLRSRYFEILSQPNILVDKIAMYVQQMLLRWLMTQSDNEERFEVSRYSLLLDNNYFNLLKTAGMIVTSGMRDFTKLTHVPKRHVNTLNDPELQIITIPKTIKRQFEIDFSNAIPPMAGGKVVVECDKMKPFAYGSRGFLYRTTVETAGKTYDLAIKICENNAESEDECRKEAKNIKLLHGCNVPNVVPLIDVIFDENRELELNDRKLPLAVLVLPFCGTSILKLGRLGLTLQNVRNCAFQLLRTLNGLDENGFVHNDLNSKNITIMNQNSWDPVVIDWSTMRLAPGTIVPSSPLATFPWRSPEWYLFQRTFDAASDVWALGSILISFSTSTNMPFYPRIDIFNDPSAEIMINLFAEELGLPPDAFVASASNREIVKPANINLNQMGRLQDRAHMGMLQLSNEDKIIARDYRDLISSCLMWIPAERLKPSVGLAHPFFGDMAAAKNTTAIAKK